MIYRQKRQQELPPPFIKIDQSGHAHCVSTDTIIHGAFLQKTSNKQMKFHDNNQNNTQYVRISYNKQGIPWYRCIPYIHFQSSCLWVAYSEWLPNPNLNLVMSSGALVEVKELFYKYGIDQ